MKLSPLGVYFSVFLGFMRLTTGRPAGPIVKVNGSNDTSWWRSHPFYGFVNEKLFFSYFSPRNVKLFIKNCKQFI